jgi:hypothetical protein
MGVSGSAYRASRRVRLGRSPAGKRIRPNRITAEIDGEGDLFLCDDLGGVVWIRPHHAYKLALWLLQQEEFRRAYTDRRDQRDASGPYENILERIRAEYAPQANESRTPDQDRRSSEGDETGESASADREVYWTNEDS